MTRLLRRPHGEDRRTPVPRYAKGLVLLVLGVLIVLSAGSIRYQSPTFDEPNWLAIAWYLTHTWSWQADYHVLMHPPLSFYLHGIPLRLWEAWHSPSSPPPEGALAAQFPYPYAEFFRYETVFTIAKVAMLPLPLLLGWYIYLWASRLYGWRAGIAAVILYAFNPYILAYATIITSDMPAACLMFIAAYHFWRFCRYPSRRHIVWSGITLGLALLAKASAVLLSPIFCLLGMNIVLYRTIWQKRSILQDTANKLTSSRTIMFHPKKFAVGLGLVIGLALCVLEAGYLFDMQPVRAFQPQQRSDLAYQMFKDIPIPFGAHINSIRLHQSFILSMTRKQFLAGEVSTETWWYYHLLTFLFKNPIPLVVFLGLSLCVWKKRPSLGRSLLFREIFLAFPAGVVFFYFSFLFPLKVSSRFVLPAYPFLFVLSSRIMTFRRFRRRSARIVLWALLVWYIMSSIAAFPHYLAYCNELIGGTEQGYAWFADSSHDWGQDLKGLGQYMHRHQIPEIKLAYFGKAIPEYYGIRYTPLLEPEGCVPTTGWIAISTTRLQGVYEQNQQCYAWLKQYEPIDKIGYTIFIYAIP